MSLEQESPERQSAGKLVDELMQAGVAEDVVAQVLETSRLNRQAVIDLELHDNGLANSITIKNPDGEILLFMDLASDLRNKDKSVQ